MDEFAKIKDENEELKGKLRDSQASFRALQNDFSIVTDKVSSLEERAKAFKECVTQEEFNRDAAIQEVMEQAIEDFNRPEKYTATMTTQYDTGYDTKVEEIFFNI